MAYKSNGKGSFIIDRQFPGVGEIRRASGTTDPLIHEGIVGARRPAAEGGGRTKNMLDELKEAGRTDLLTAMRDGRLLPVNVYHQYRLHGVKLQMTPEAISPLEEEIDAWLDDEDNDLAEKTKTNYRYMLKAIAKERSTLSDLPDLLWKLRAKCKKKPRLFNHTRSAAQALIRDRVAKGKFSELWIAVSSIPVLSVTRKKGNPQPVERALAIAEKMDDLSGKMWWTLCCTGMGWKEYNVDGWDDAGDRIDIFGQKREKRLRTVPRICTPIRPVCSEKIFAKRIAKAAAELGYGHVTIRDARRTYSLWMRLANIPKVLRDCYMGHKAVDLDDLYPELGESAAEHFLPQSTASLKAYIGGAVPQLIKAMA